jgi:hypothetical protein
MHGAHHGATALARADGWFVLEHNLLAFEPSPRANVMLTFPSF